MAENDTNLGEDIDWAPYDLAAAVISFLLCILIVIFNGCLIRVLLKKKYRKNRLHFFILHLAIADFLVGGVNCLGDGITSALGGWWYGGDVMCRIYRFLCVVFLVASNNLLIGMSLDRFLAVAYPMRFYKSGTKFDKGLVLGAWGLSLLLASTYPFYTKGTNGPPVDDGGCMIMFPAHWWRAYSIIIVAAIYILPLTAILLCYTGICVVVWRKWRENLQLSETTKITQSGPGQAKTKVDAGGGYLSKAKIKSIKLTLIVCIAFIFCWTPYCLFTLMDTFGYASIDRRLFVIFGSLYPLNSVVNPIVFILFNIHMFVQVNRKRNSYATEEDEPPTVTTV